MQNKTLDQYSAPVAIVNGEPLAVLPDDLYIPPEALRVFLETFSGPLDLLLYLIKKQNIDILDIPVAKITAQYIEYIDLMKELKLELAAEYLVMAAMLAEIKSRLLLPKPVDAPEEEEDPRAELVRRLMEYECYKKAAENLDELPRMERDVFTVDPAVPEIKTTRPLPKIELPDLYTAFQNVLKRAAMFAHHQIKLESLSVREKMSHVLLRISEQGFVQFHDLFVIKEGRLGVVVTFVAILELLKQAMIEVVQVEQFAPIHLQVINNEKE